MKEFKKEIKYIEDKLDSLDKTKRGIDITLFLILALTGISLLLSLNTIHILTVYLIIIFVILYLSSMNYKETIKKINSMKKKFK